MMVTTEFYDDKIYQIKHKPELSNRDYVHYDVYHIKTDDDNYSHIYKAIKSIMNDGSWRKDEWIMKCQQQPSTENELHPYHTFSYNAELNVYVYCIIKPLCD